MSILDGIFTGFVIGLLMATPSVVFELVRHSKELPLLMDITTFWGVKLTREQTLFWSIAVHLVTSALFGALIPFFVSVGALSPLYVFGEIIMFSFAFFLITGCVIFPIVGFGFFGKKEGEFVWLELLLTNLLYGTLFWAAAHLLVL